MLKKSILATILFTLWAVLLLSSCQKQESFRHPDKLTDETIIEGHVRDPWGMPLPGAFVNCSVLAGKAYQNTWSYLLPALTTDSNGYYRFHHTDTRDVIGYEVKASLDGYYAPGTRQAQKHWHNIRDFELRPHAWIRVHFKNVDYFNEWDRCILYFTSFGIQDPVGVLGNADEFRLLKGAGGTPSYLYWKVTRDGIESEFRDTLILAGHDTTYYLIEF